MTTTPVDTTDITDIADAITDASAVAARIVHRLEAAWNAGDGAAYAAPYTRDATFVTVRGEHLRGRHAIAEGHAGIFAGIYADSTNRMVVLHARHLARDVIVVTSHNTLDVPRGPLAGVRAAASTSILVRTADGWRVAHTHNTLEVTR